MSTLVSNWRAEPAEGGAFFSESGIVGEIRGRIHADKISLETLEGAYEAVGERDC